MSEIKNYYIIITRTIFVKCGVNCHQNGISTFRDRRGGICAPPPPDQLGLSSILL